MRKLAIIDFDKNSHLKIDVPFPVSDDEDCCPIGCA